MKNFAIIENGIVENIIIAESKSIAESLTGKTCVEYDENGNNRAHIGLSYNNGVFEQLPTSPLE